MKQNKSSKLKYNTNLNNWDFVYDNSLLSENPLFGNEIIGETIIPSFDWEFLDNKISKIFNEIFTIIEDEPYQKRGLNSYPKRIKTLKEIRKGFESPKPVWNSSSSLMERFPKNNNILKLQDVNDFSIDVLPIRKLINKVPSKINSEPNRFKNIKINDDGSILIGDSSISKQTINELINGVISVFTNQDSNEKLESIFSKIPSKIQNTLVEFLKLIIIPILLYFLLPIYENEFGNPFKFMFNNPHNSSKKELIQNVKKELGSELKNDSFKNHRVVTSDGLILREYPTIQSKKLGLLYRGKLIKVIQKNRNWTFIEVNKKNDETVCGWVFTRYISKLTK